MSLSSNSIIHFTKTKESLIGILESNFQINYCKETIHFSNEYIPELLVPMVSFCDIPLSEVKHHIRKYGNYGIGLTKEWAENHGLNPVLYINKNSELANSYSKALDKYVSEKEGDLDDLNLVEKNVLNVIRYIKNYEADLNRGGSTIKNYRFSDEREWRYVPSLATDCDMVLNFEYVEDENNIDEVDIAKSKLETLELTFTPNDIKYIIIENDEEISEFLDILRKAKGKTYSYHDIERLMTRILTTEQIVSDI